MTTITKGRNTVWVVDPDAKTVVSDPTKVALTADGFVLGDLGHKHQLVKLRCNGVEWNFAAGAFAFVTTDEYLSQTLTKVLSSAFISSAIIAQTSTSFTIRYTLVGTTTMDVKGLLANGQMELWVDSVVIDPAFFLTHSGHHTAIRLLVSPPSATSTTCHALLPYSSGEMVRNAKTSIRTVGVTSPVPAADYPGFRKPYPSEVYSAGSGFSCFAVWDTSTNDCLAIRIKNPNSRGTRWEYTGTGTALDFSFIDYPDDNILDQTVSMVTRVVLRPMKGNWYDACNWYRSEHQAASYVGMSRGKIYQASDYSNARKEADYFLGLAPGNDSPPTLITNDASKWARCLEEIQRVRDWMGPDVHIYVHWGSWMANPVTSWPLAFPVQSNAQSTIIQAATMPNVVCGVYTFPLIVDPLSDWWNLDPTGNALLVQQNPAGLEYTEEYFGTENYIFQWGNATARAAIVALYSDIHGEFDGQISGIYLDTTSGASTNGDYRASLAASQRGPGSPYFHQGTASLIQELKDTFFGLSGSRLAIIGEFYAEHLIHKVDSQGGYLALYPDIFDFAILVPAYVQIYSEYVHRWDFATGGLDSVTASSYDDWEVHMWTQERQFHAGMLLGQQYSGFPDQKLPFVPEAGDAQAVHTPYGVYQHVKMLFHRACAQALRKFKLREYFRGRRLRPPVNSTEWRLEHYGYEIATDTPFAGGHNQAKLLNAEVQFSVWHSDELNAIGLVFTNDSVLPKSTTLELYEDTHPEIAAYPYLYVRDEDGNRVYVRRHTGALSLAVTVNPSSVLVYELLPTGP